MCNFIFYYICNMKDRILKLITHLGLTASRFADEISVQRSGISHILSGRNQPSYDFIVKTMKRFPEINLDWLILGKGAMLKSNKIEETLRKTDLFTAVEGDKVYLSTGKQGLDSEVSNADMKKKVTYVNSMEQIVIFYSDGSFKPYFPAANG
jgi:transcriptional regulator with XRE-family HTH domain